MRGDAPMPTILSYDVAIVGCGISGLSAAVAAQQHGAKVAILERAPMTERGGNTRYTESFWRMKSETAVSDDFIDRFGENAGGHLDPEIVKDAARPYEDWPGILKTLNFTDPELISSFAEQAGPALQWLKSFGVSFDFLPNYFISESTTRIAPVGGGWALIEALAGYAEAHSDDITFHYETTAKFLLADDGGRKSTDRHTRQGRRAGVRRVRGQSGNAEPLHRSKFPMGTSDRPRRLLQSGRRDSHGPRYWRGTQWRLRQLPRPARRPAFRRDRTRRAQLRLRHSGQSRGTSLYR